MYVSHVREWRQQFDKLESVDLRYDRQIIVNPDLQGTAKQPPLSKSSAKVAMAAGMKPAALITRQVPPPKPTPTVATSQPQPKVVAKKTPKKAHHKVAKAPPKPSDTPGQTQSVAQTNAPSTQSPSTQSTPAPNTLAAPTTAKTTPGAPPAAGIVVTKPGSKPSPAIVKGEEHP